MKSALLCLLRGCAWEDGDLLQIGHELMLHQCCRRCGAHRYSLAPAGR